MRAGKAVEVKICGLTRAYDIESVCQAKVDYSGFVFAKSKRQLTSDQAGDLIKLLPASIKAVAVFANNNIDFILNICEQMRINVIQLHGDETLDFICDLRRLLKKKHLEIEIWKQKSYTVYDKETLNQSFQTSLEEKETEQFEHSLAFSQNKLPDAWVIDSISNGQKGGTGLAFRWEKAKIFCENKRIVLAGGLNQGNVSQAIRILNPAIVDCSSGVETNGIKDRQKIYDFCQKAKETDNDG